MGAQEDINRLQFLINDSKTALAGNQNACKRGSFKSCGKVPTITQNLEVFNSQLDDLLGAKPTEQEDKPTIGSVFNNNKTLILIAVAVIIGGVVIGKS